MYQPAPPRRPNQRGPSRKKGDRLAGMAEWAADATPWETLEFDQYGLHATLQVKTIQALYYKAGRTGCSRSSWSTMSPEVAPTRCSTARGPPGCGDPDPLCARWSVEVMHYNAKQMMGLEDPANRTAQAVQRTAPGGVGAVRVDLDLVPHGGSSVVVLSRSSVVSGQGRAVVCGYPGGPAAETGVVNSRMWIGSGVVRKPRLRAYRVCQPPRLSSFRHDKSGSDDAESHQTTRPSGSGAVADRKDFLRNPN